MDINRNNYEAYLLDLLEGRLTAEDQCVVREFLLLNPDCRGGLDGAEPWILEKSGISFPGREQLKKVYPDGTSILTETNFDLFSIARLEGDLTHWQEKDYGTMVARDEDKSREWEDWQKTKLTSVHITFSGKEKLKKSKGVNARVIWLSVVSSVAVIALLISFLRIDTVVPGPDLIEEVSTLHSLEEYSSPLFGNEKAEFTDHPVALSIKKNPDPTELTGTKKGAGDSKVTADTVQQVRQQQIQPRSLRIASVAHRDVGFINRGSYDQIRPLEIPPVATHLTSLSFSQLATMDRQELFDEYTRENDISIWSIANAGIKGINRITGADLSLLAFRNEEGDVSGFRFKSRRFSVSAPLERAE